MGLVIFTANLDQVDMKKYLQHFPSLFEAAAKIHPFYSIGFPWYWNEIALNIKLDILQDFISRSISYLPYHEFVFDF